MIPIYGCSTSVSLGPSIKLIVDTRRQIRLVAVKIRPSMGIRRNDDVAIQRVPGCFYSALRQ